MAKLGGGGVTVNVPEALRVLLPMELVSTPAPTVKVWLVTVFDVTVTESVQLPVAGTEMVPSIPTELPPAEANGEPPQLEVTAGVAALSRPSG